MGDREQRLRELLAQRSGTNAKDWFLVFRARMGMQAVFEELAKRYGKGDVITQLFTCATVPASICASGMRPVYGDIHADTLALNPQGLPITEQTRALIYQHTFGIFDAKTEETLRRCAHKEGLLFMEDSAHCVGALSRTSKGEPLADVSVHSLGIEKVASALFGGAIWINPAMEDEELRDALVERLSQLPLPSKRMEQAVSSYTLRLRVLNHLPAVLRTPLRSHWVRTRRFLPGVTDAELRGKSEFEPMAIGEAATKRCLDELATLDANEKQRKEAARLYIEAFSMREGCEVPASVLSELRPYLWFPLVVDTPEHADKILSLVNSLGYYASSWGRPVLYAGVPDPAPFNFNGNLDDWPVCARCSAGIVPLPTSKSSEQVAQIIDVVVSQLRH